MSVRMVRAAGSSDVTEGKLLAVRVDGSRILMSRVRGQVHAVVDRCPHMGLSMARGRIEGGIVTCPWHHSRFDICTGNNMDWASALLGIPMPKWMHGALAMGKSPAPLATLTVEERDGEITIAL
jgi:nitrite reductase/ring-hydroxylating ferredoxin subunit